MEGTNRFAVLYAEDSEDDVLLLRFAFEQAQIVNPLQIVRDGRQAIDYLAGEGRFGDRQEFPVPGLLLLDLKLPRKTGLEVLEWIRLKPGLKKLPVIILSASSQVRDIADAYDLGANAFLVKPSGAHILLDMARALKHFWLTYNKNPLDSDESHPVS